MKCPLCGKAGAYVGLKEVECPNADCASYKADMSPLVDAPYSGKQELAYKDINPDECEFDYARN